MNYIYKKDIECNLNDSVEWGKLKNKTIFITGATGIIGRLLTTTIAFANQKYNLNCKLILLVRNYEKAMKMFEDIMNFKNQINIIEGNILNEINIEERIDFIIHAASVTNSKTFIDEPIETIDTIIKGTENTLKIAAKNKNSKYIFLSTMEVYGCPKNDDKIKEDSYLYLNSRDVRNSYPISKLISESMCFAYSKKYNFTSNILRLTQTFGAGVNYDDKRVFAEFARCAIEKNDIVLHTQGRTKRCYLYTSDAISAILTIMFDDNINGDIYNVANENTYCSIYDMAMMLAEKYNIKVKIDIKENEEFGYASELCMNLDCSKLMSKNWKPKKELEEMFENLIESLKLERKMK